jgi:hypothetical protein
MTQRLVYNISGQVLRHTPEVRVATATWVLEDMMRSAGSPAKTLDSGSVVVDAATEAITADAGPAETNPRQVLVASTAAFVVGTRYEIFHAASGVREPVEVVAIDTNVSLSFRDPLFATYPTGSVVQGTELVTAAVLDAVVQDEPRMQLDDPLRIVWTFPAGSGRRHHQELVRLVRYDHGDVDLARARADVYAVFPDTDTRFAYKGRDTLTPHIRVVYLQLRAMLLDRKIRIEEWLVGDQGHFALVWRTLWHLAQLGNKPGGDDQLDPTAWAEYCKGEFDRFWGALTIGEGGAEVGVIEPHNDVLNSTTDQTYRKVFGEL